MAESKITRGSRRQVESITFASIGGYAWSYLYIPDTPLYSEMKKTLKSIYTVCDQTAVQTQIALHPTNGYLYVSAYNAYSQPVTNVTVDIFMEFYE